MMPPSTPTPRISPIEFLRGRQWQDEHQHLLQRVKEQDTTINRIHGKTEKASQASATAINDVVQLKKDFESYIDDPQHNEKDLQIYRILKEHNEDLFALRKMANSWRPMFQSCKDDITQIEEAVGHRIENVEDRLKEVQDAPSPDIDTPIRGLVERVMSLEKQHHRLSGVENLVATTKLTIESLRTTCNAQEDEISQLKQQLEELRKQPSRSEQIQVPQSPVLIDTHLPPSALHPTSDCETMDKPQGEQHVSSIVHPASDRQTTDEQQNHLQPMQPAYKIANGILLDRQYPQEMQTEKLTQNLSTETPLTTQIAVGEREPILPTIGNTTEPYDPRKRAKQSLDPETEHLRQMMQSQGNINSGRNRAPKKPRRKTVKGSALQATARARPVKSRDKDPAQMASTKSIPNHKQLDGVKVHQGPQDVPTQNSQRVTRRNPERVFMSLNLRTRTIEQLPAMQGEGSLPPSTTDPVSTILGPLNHVGKRRRRQPIIIDVSEKENKGDETN